MRKILLVVLCVLLVITTVACGGKHPNKTDIAVDTAGNIIEDTAADIASNLDTVEEYTELVGEYNLPIEEELIFYNGTEDGSLANTITISQDGSFYGSYYELDSSLTGENYQNGTYYWNTYWGNFSNIIWIDEFTYSMQLDYLATEKEEGVERLEDDSFRSITKVEMLGVSKGAEYVLFTPYTPIHMLPDNVKELLNEDLSNQDSLEKYVLLDTEKQIIFKCDL